MSRFIPETPNLLIYFGAILRPKTLRPHLRVPNINNVDFDALKKAGYNAVVIDKDNCLTIPETDTVHPTLTRAWSDLKKTFPGRVLVVSNSAGLLSKDPGAIAAESVSLSLQAPILIHPRAKPGCSKTVLSYFNGTLGQPTTLRGQLRSQATKLREEEEGDEDIVVSKWKDEIQGPILGPLVDKDGKVIDQEERRMGSEEEGKDHELGGRMRERQISGESHSESSSSMTPTATPTSPVTTATTSSDHTVSPAVSADTMAEPKILVIGDRMFTDTLLANRLAKLLPTPSPFLSSAQSNPSPTTLITPTPSVLSIHTTLLLQPSDVRFLRLIEETLTRSRVREGPIDWARYTITIPTPILPPALSWKDKINPFRDTPPLTWSPKTWRPKPLLAGTGAGLLFLGRKLGQGLYYLGGRIWEGEVEVAKAMAARAEVAQAERKVMQVKEGVATAVHDVGHKA